MNKTCLELCVQKMDKKNVKKIDKLESDDFRNKMKNEFELICKAFNESKMLWLVWLFMATVCLRFMGDRESSGGGRIWKRKKGKKRERKKKMHRLSCG